MQLKLWPLGASIAAALGDVSCRNLTWPPAMLVPCRQWFDEQAFAAAVAPHGVRVVAPPAADVATVSIEEFHSQSKVGALVAHLKLHEKQQHIR